ncbi:MAG: DUF1700 domain-containing protein [Lachnospiraceae bacterium]|nr:DUF1700 domain-containing protein [Lachnospiraceae bacterium]
MNRAEFMSRLASLLQDVPLAEREEALQYYNDYFDDAGEGNEESTIASLGSPEEIAKSIKAGLTDDQNAGEFTESGFYSYEQKSKNQVMSTEQMQNADQGDSQKRQGDPYGPQGNTGSNGYGTQPNSGSREAKEPLSGGKIALIVLLAVLLSPVWIGVLGGIFGGFVGLLGGALGIFVAFLVVGVVLTVVGAALFVIGIAAILGAPLGGLCLMGGGLIMVALGLVFIWLTVIIVGMAIPALVRGIVSLCNRIFHRGGAQA